MKHFLIQVSEQDGQVLHDFAFRLLDALRYLEWRHPLSQYSKSFSVAGESMKELLLSGIHRKDIVPIGSLAFVRSRMNELEYHGVQKITPLNIPAVLNDPEFLGRRYEAGVTKAQLLEGNRPFPLFVKSADQYKGFVDILNSTSCLSELSAMERYDVSEVVDIQTEWRVFVQRDEIIGAKPYGCQNLFPKPPHTGFLNRMVRHIEKKRSEGMVFPLSYTLDVGVSLDGSFLIECHPFVSCGLYGFDDLERLPSMLIQGYAFFQQQAEKEEGDA